MVAVILAELVETFVGVAQEALQVEHLGRPHAGETAAGTCKTPSGKSVHSQDTCTGYQYAARSVPGEQLDQCQTVLASSFCACGETLHDSFHYQATQTSDNSLEDKTVAGVDTKSGKANHETRVTNSHSSC